MKKKIISLILALMTVLTVLPAVGSAAAGPEYTVTGYTVSVQNMSEANYVRFAPGVHATSNELRAAPGLVQLDQKRVQAKTVSGVFSYDMPASGDYTMWIRYNDSTSVLFSYTVEAQDPALSFYGLQMTVTNLEGVNYIIVASGDRSTYRECANNKVLGFPGTRITDIKKFSYPVPVPGEYTVCLKYENGTNKLLHGTSTVDRPVLTPDGISLTVGNIPDVYVIRVAKGEYATSGEVKRAAGSRNFSAKTIKSADPYVIAFPQDGSGTYTVAVQYNNGYIELNTVEIQKKVPTVEKSDHSITFGSLDGLYVIRYAPGEYSTAGDIKRAPGSVYVRPEQAGEAFTVSELNGTYSFLVQYRDGSINVMTYTFEDAQPQEPEDPPVIELARDFNVSRAFGDHMVVQRDKKLTVWGWAPESENGRYVCVIFKDIPTLAIVQNGFWYSEYEGFPASTEPAVMSFIGDGKSQTFVDILVGDVYLVIGQSNVYWPYYGVVQDCVANGAGDTVADFNTSDSNYIRLMRNSSTFYQNLTGVFAQGTRVEFPDVVSPNAVWQTPSQGASEFSAIGYMFAFRLAQNVNVPIGMIEIDASGYPLSSFAPNELVDKWKSDYPNPDNPDAGLVRIGNDEAGYVNTTLASRFAYNQQLYPFLRFCIAGILWYQGESDFTSTQMLYGPDQTVFINEFTELMAYYRSHLGNGDYPIYVVEYPSHYSNNGANPFIDFGYARTELGTAHMRIPDCYLVASSDLWRNITFWNNPHPYCKPAQALRAAQLALSTNYDAADVKTSIPETNNIAGPQISGVTKVDANTVKVTFDYVGTGLTTYGGQAPKGFQVMTSYEFPAVSNWATPTSVVISAPNELTITYSAPIYGVRYHYGTEFYYPTEVNVCASTGIPMVAFARYWK
ncbi:MAG: hypothetical protein IJR90_05865 [Clostridia bacterium]|nr:hypothetical protein [Clostridia bacterium]